MKVNIEDIIEAKKYFKSINTHELSEIEFYKGGKKLKIAEDIIRNFKYLGFNNVDFISMGIYKGNAFK